MSNKDFLSKNINIGKELLVGLVSIDIVKHSTLKGSENDKAKTLKIFENFIKSQINDTHFALLPWQGDGGIVLFDMANKCEEVVIFADRIRQLLPLFNRTRGLLNSLPCQQELVVRIVCHAGTIFNKDGTTSNTRGEPINLLAKKEREIGEPGNVVLSEEIYKRLPYEFKERCQFPKEHPDFVRTYVLDGRVALGSIICNDRESTQLREWIISTCNHRKYDRLLYFAYTNELLFDLLAYRLPDLKIKILARNWVVERKDEDEFHKEFREIGETEKDWIRRRWFKSPAIKTRAEEMIFNIAYGGKSVDMRFYDAPPLFNGAILESEAEEPCAFIGISRWEKRPEKGGSQYKLEDWPAVTLDGRYKIHAWLINYLSSRFREIWERGRTYEEVLEQEKTQKSMDPSIVGQIWALDDQPYLLVYPHRKVPDRSFPVVPNEDVMAFHLIESFLNEYGIRVALLPFQKPSNLNGEWLPAETQDKIDKWKGHVVYICNWSISPTLKKFLFKQGFPYELKMIGTESPFLQHRKKKEIVFKSPSDEKPPQPRDYSMVARFKRPHGSGVAYIAAGIRAMGTWGAAHYLTNRNDIQKLSPFVKDKQFVAVVETVFDPNKYKVTDSRLYIAPEEF